MKTKSLANLFFFMNKFNQVAVPSAALRCIIIRAHLDMKADKMDQRAEF